MEENLLDEIKKYDPMFKGFYLDNLTQSPVLTRRASETLVDSSPLNHKSPYRSKTNAKDKNELISGEKLTQGDNMGSEKDPNLNKLTSSEKNNENDDAESNNRDSVSCNKDSIREKTVNVEYARIVSGNISPPLLSPGIGSGYMSRGEKIDSRGELYTNEPMFPIYSPQVL